jgi:transglutaminase-like putative cysteine protease/poly(3-hydroxybutyrate) depolymerase
MRHLWMILGLSGVVLGAPLDDFINGARERHGEPGERAARFLVEHMPDRDRDQVSSGFLIENLDLAFQARAEFRWAQDVPEDLFLNDVLPYAVFDEPRDPWRAELLALARGIVGQATTASEAAQALNRELFNRIKVHYNTGRKRPNQSPKESIELGMATCTGLSIILVDACRAVGIPARAVGTPLWANGRGNHTWIEVWDNGWYFTGADEYDAAGLNRGWFVGDAAQAKADEPRHAIYATSWKREGLTFPMVWSRRSDAVAAVNVTARYARAAEPKPDVARLGVRLWEQRPGNRLVAGVTVLDSDRRPGATGETKAGTADLNDMPRFELASGARGWLRFNRGGEVRELAFGPADPGEATLDAVWGELRPVTPTMLGLEAWLALPAAERPADAPVLQAPLDRVEAERAVELLFADRLACLAAERKEEMENKAMTRGDRTLRWLSKTFGEAPPGGRSLWISMHGGGNAPARVNDRQWQNQAGLYEPAEGIYVAPRAPTDTWNLWHEAHIDPLFQRLIDNHVALAGVDPDRVYLLGYSAGGDGVWQLAPRMADRLAAAAMMAGHPNEASLLGLRNLPFALFMGGNDGAYNRNRVATERAAELARLAAADPGGYVHLARIYDGLGHWMNKQDAEALPWMAQFRRQPWPAKVVWQQDDVVHRRFYWLQLPDDLVIPDRQQFTAALCDGVITLSGDVPTTLVLRLSDRLVDLDQPVTVRFEDREVFQGQVVRRAAAILASLEERLDAASAATARLELGANSGPQP